MARDPDAIQREIEATRAELAHTIDAIAEKVSPQRAAARGRETLKVAVADFRAQLETQRQGPDGQIYRIKRELRKDRVAMAGGAVAGVALLLGVRRRRRRRAARLVTAAAVGRAVKSAAATGRETGRESRREAELAARRDLRRGARREAERSARRELRLSERRDSRRGDRRRARRG